MKAWFLYGINDLRLESVDPPAPKDDEVLVKVKCVQLSVSEVQVIKGLNLDLGRYEKVRKEIEAGKAASLGLGHEFCGEVVKGDLNNNFAPGDLVFARPNIPCGKCSQCIKGRFKYCKNNILFPGALRELVSADPRFLVKVPKNLTPSEIAALQPLSSAIRFAANGRIAPGDAVAIIGCGVMGLNVMQAVRGTAGSIFAIDVDEKKLELASKFGANYCINPNKVDLVKEIWNSTEGLGVNVVFECAGGSPKVGLSGLKTLSQAFEIVRKGGKIVQVAQIEGKVEFTPGKLYSKGVSYIFADGWAYQSDNRSYFELAAELVSRKEIDLKSMMTHAFTGIEKVPESIEITANKAKYGAINPAQVMY
jgi:threonine dehydrogenase-like Zn-dependent dehydrogenase